MDNDHLLTKISCEFGAWIITHLPDCINQVVMLKCYLGEGSWAKFALEMSKTIRWMNSGEKILKILMKKWKNQENWKSWFKSMIFLKKSFDLNRDLNRDLNQLI